MLPVPAAIFCDSNMLLYYLHVIWLLAIGLSRPVPTTPPPIAFQPPPVVPNDFFPEIVTEPAEVEETSTSSSDSSTLVQLSAFLAAVGLILFMVGAVVLYLCYMKRLNVEKLHGSTEFDPNSDTVRVVTSGKKRSRKAKSGEVGSPPDGLSCGDIQSQVHTQK